MARRPPDGAAEELLTSGEHADFRVFAEDCQRIQTKNGELVPFRLNRSQKFRQSMIEEMQAAKIPLRIWEAKARQLGASTHYQAWMFWRCITSHDESALVAAHADMSARVIFKKCKTFFDQLPVELQPMTKYNNRAELDFRDPRGAGGLRSSFTVMTAKSVEDARGSMYRHAHLSEVAFYKQPKRFFLATLQGVPKQVGTSVFVESTCNGSGDFHHEMYLKGRVWWRDEDGNPDPPPWMTLKKENPGDPNSEWFSLFTPWFLMEEYRSSLPSEEEEFRRELSLDERELLNDFPDFVTLEHLQWRRETIASKCGGDLAQWRQEYPATDSEAFAASGSVVFNKDDMRHQVESNRCYCEWCQPHTGYELPETTCPPHEWFEIVDASGAAARGDKMFIQYKPLLAPAPPGGRMSVWQHPEKGRRYLVSADVSKGGVGSDYDHLVVMDIERHEQVAEWRGKVELHEMADICILVSMYYNTATLAPEVTGLGAGLLAIIERTRYPMLYRRRVFDSLQGHTIMLGWDTNKKTKPATVGLMQKDLRNRDVVIRSPIVLDEMSIYRKTLYLRPDGGEGNEAMMEAPPGRNDDACMAMLIANACCHYVPGTAGPSKGRVRKPMREALDHTKWDDEQWERYDENNRGGLSFYLTRMTR